MLIYHAQKTGNQIEISVKSPTEYVSDRLQDFLPDWNRPALSVIIVLQQASLKLQEVTEEVAAAKNHLRKEFLCFGCALITSTRDEDWLSDIFDPRTGKALFSHEGYQTHDDTRVIAQLLGYERKGYNDCSLLHHPKWDTAVYPGVLISSATPEAIQPYVDSAAKFRGRQRELECLLYQLHSI